MMPNGSFCLPLQRRLTYWVANKILTPGSLWDNQARIFNIVVIETKFHFVETIHFPAIDIGSWHLLIWKGPQAGHKTRHHNAMVCYERFKKYTFKDFRQICESDGAGLGTARLCP